MVSSTGVSQTQPFEPLIAHKMPQKGSMLQQQPLSSGSEPDQQSVEIPNALESEATLHFFGLNAKRSSEIWKRWNSFNSDDYSDDFGDFTRTYLRNLVEYEGCDSGAPNTDWRPYLEKIGADASLSSAIAGEAKHDGIRLTKSAAEWVEQAIEWRWEWLLARAMRGSNINVQVRALTDIQLGKEDVTEIIWDRKKFRATTKGGSPLNHIPLWRCTSCVRAEKMWSGPPRTGNFSIANQRSMPPTDFSGLRSVHYWTPDLELAQKYAGYAKKLAEPSSVCLIRIEVPMKLLKEHKPKLLRFPDENFKRLVYFSRNGEDVQPKDLQREIMKHGLLVGDTVTGINRAYNRMQNWTDIGEKHLLKLESGEPVTQFVFGHRPDDLQDEMNRLEKFTTIRNANQSRALYEPLSAEAIARK